MGQEGRGKRGGQEGRQEGGEGEGKRGVQEGRATRIVHRGDGTESEGWDRVRAGVERGGVGSNAWYARGRCIRQGVDPVAKAY